MKVTAQPTKSWQSRKQEMKNRNSTEWIVSLFISVGIIGLFFIF